MKTDRYIILWAISFITTVAALSLPYNPTHILQDPNNKSFTYVFRPASDVRTHQLISVDASSKLIGTNLTFDIVSERLPFSTDDGSAFLPTISERGDISVYAGACGSPTTSTLWRFTNFNASSKGSGTWAQVATRMTMGPTSSATRAYFLARAFEFSTFVNANSSQTKVYIFGGMCPENGTNTTIWQNAAQYSNHMMRLSPITDMNYSVDLTTSRSSPVAEAGFSLTQLTPTYSNSSNVRTQQQNIVLIGGHTESAFISMSQVAIWSLPEEAWTFVKVEIPATTNANAEAIGEGGFTSIDSRSGHTAVLTEDGSKIVVYGGWVGDIGQAAEPQLAVLSLGSGYGGSGIWEWTIPSIQPPGSGRYGHGATMLPGNVMMVTGGFNIATHAKRGAESGLNAMFFNVTSLTWSSNYTNPEYKARESLTKVPSSLGMRIAVGLGLAAVAGTVLLCVGYKRHRKHKGRREDNLRGLSAIATNSNSNPGREMRSTSGIFPWSNGGWNQEVNEVDNHNSNLHRGPTQYENMSLVADGLADSTYILPPVSKHLLSKTSYSKLRGAYQPANYETSALRTGHGTAGAIHPIYEADENDEEDNTGDIGLESSRPLSARNTSESRRHSDPFKDPQTHRAPLSRPNLPSSLKTHDLETYPREQEIKEWVTECAGVDHNQARSISSTGQVSPGRRATIVTASSPGSLTAEEDHGSILSEQTEHSVHTASENSRSSSIRGFIMGMNPFGSNDRSKPPQKSDSAANLTTALDNSNQPMAQLSRLTLGSAHSSRSGKSFRSAQTSIIALQNEGEHLLPQPVERASIRTVSPTGEDQEFPMIGSPSKLKPHTIGRSNASWLGSLKRALAALPEDHSPILNSYDSKYQNIEASSSHIFNEKGSSREAHLTESTGGNLWRRKQGKPDLADSNPISPVAASGCSKLPDEIMRSVAPARESEEWDMGRSVENQLVPVTHTDSRERLQNDKSEQDGNVSKGFRDPTSVSKEKKKLPKSSNPDLAAQKSYEKRLTNQVHAEAVNDEIPKSAKGKEKVGGYVLSQRLTHTQMEEYEDGDISLRKNIEKRDHVAQGTDPEVSPGMGSKFNSRKSKVLEMVERMEAHS